MQIIQGNAHLIKVGCPFYGIFIFCPIYCKKHMYLLFDIGGSNMRLSVSDGKKLDRITMIPTPKDFKSAILVFEQCMKKLDTGKLNGVVGGVPMFSGDSLGFWSNNPAQKTLEKITKTKVMLVNDAELAGIGESIYGAGKDYGIVGYLTFSTGIGGAKIVNQQIDPNAFGFEPTVQIACYNPATKTSIPIRKFTTGRELKNKYGKPAEKVKDRKVWAKAEDWMKVALINAAVFWSPECLVLGGSVAHNKRISTKRLQAALDKHFKNFPHKPKLVKSELGQLGGLYGAMAMT
jgi:predicted NBD/HSP70 family sugar kinase